jgi:hypothetical protein
MFEGYLEYGGVEVVNSRRVSDLALSDGVAWIMGPTYPELETSISTDSGFDLSDPTQAPWYDANRTDLSTRFYGVYGLSVTAAYDSVKTTPVTQNAGDGGVLGASRKGTKSIVVKATLLALGADAMEFGRAWLQSVLDLGNCGQEGDCERADALFFAAIPNGTTSDALEKSRYLKFAGTTSGPFAVNEYASRGVYNTDVEWTWTSEKPYIYGPERDVTLSVATSLALIQDSPINWIPYPSAELPFAQPIYTNLITNPSMEGLGNASILLTNLSTNPSIETATTGYSAIPGTTGVAALTSAAPSTTTAYGTKVLKCTWSTASTAVGGGVSHGVLVTAGLTYSFAFRHVKTSIVNTLQFSVDWLNNASAVISNSAGNTIACSAGAINTTFQLLNVVAPVGAVSASVKVISTAAGVVNSINSFIEVDGVQVIQAGFLPTYFDGATAAGTDIGYAWTGAANASTSYMAGLGPTAAYSVSAGTGGSAILYSGTSAPFVPFIGGRSLLQQWTVASTAVRGGILMGVAGTGPAIVAGQTYSGFGYVYCSKAQLMSVELQFYDASNALLGAVTVGSSVLLVANTWTQLVVSGAAPAGAATARLFFTSEAGTGGVVWNAGDTLQLDAVMLTNTAAPIPYFDGDNAYPAGDYNLTWLGTAEASASTQQVVPVIAKNVNTNPGAELVTTGWTGTKSIVSGTDPGGRLVTGRSPLLSALGSYCFQAALTGTGTGAVATSVSTISIMNTVSIAAVPTGKLLRLSIWAASAILAGTVSAITALSVTAQFLNSGASPVGTTQTLTADAHGRGVYSISKVAIPAGAVTVVFTISANVTWSDGTTDAATSDVRIYADASTVAYFGGV